MKTNTLIPNDLEALLWRGRSAAEAHSLALAKVFEIRDSDPPLAALNMTHQAITLLIETIGFYYAHWSTYTPSEPFTEELANKIRKENAERIMSLERALFIKVLSSIEFAAKTTIRHHPGNLAAKKGRVYLGWIMDASVDAGWIPAEDREPWEGVVELRNTLVHNNGIAEITRYFSVPETVGIKLEAGQMSTGTLTFFPSLINWVIDAYARWCSGYLARSQRVPQV